MASSNRPPPPPLQRFPTTWRMPRKKCPSSLYHHHALKPLRSCGCRKKPNINNTVVNNSNTINNNTDNNKNNAINNIENNINNIYIDKNRLNSLVISTSDSQPVGTGSNPVLCEFSWGIFLHSKKNH